MNLNVKIYSAGSIGNHLENAARGSNWEVNICDIDSNAFSRTKESKLGKTNFEYLKYVVLYFKK